MTAPRIVAAGGFVLAVLATGHVPAPEKFDLPPMGPPERYGSLLLDRVSTAHDIAGVGFSHALHRTRHTCRVCHFELGFAMERGATEITEAGNVAGEFCGACHDGERAFAHQEPHCVTCHSGTDGPPRRAFKRLKKLPRTKYGDRIDWVAALERGLIAPEHSVLDEHYEPISFERDLLLEADWTGIAPAVFSHDAHGAWLDCGDCHPDLFNVKKKATKHFNMRYNLEGKFCGACHLAVAFPMDDCVRCHPGMSK